MRDTAITGSRLALQEGLRDLFEGTLREAGLGLRDMATRPFGRSLKLTCQIRPLGF